MVLLKIDLLRKQPDLSPIFITPLFDGMIDLNSISISPRDLFSKAVVISVFIVYRLDFIVFVEHYGYTLTFIFCSSPRISISYFTVRTISSCTRAPGWSFFSVLRNAPLEEISRVFKLRISAWFSLPSTLSVAEIENR